MAATPWFETRCFAALLTMTVFLELRHLHDSLDQIGSSGNAGAACALGLLRHQGTKMDSQLKAWKLRADRFWSAASPDYREAAQLAADIAGSRADEALRKAAAQVLPSLRNAMLARADRSTRDLAKRRLTVVRDLLHTLSATPFGKRGPAPEPLTPQEHHRQMLGLPFGRRLSVPEIQQAYKRAAKTTHPDGGGSVRDFVRLSAARDALIKEK
jgi:hypothetical protein